MNTPTPPATISREATQAAVIAELARDGVAKHQLLQSIESPGVAPRLVWPDKTIFDLEGTLPNPLRKRATAVLATAESFASYINAFKDTGTLLVGNADERAGRFTAFLDYHEPIGKPRWTEHTAVMNLEPTPEWTRWLGISGRELDQRTFAEFVEDNAIDLTVPEGEAGKAFPTQQDLLSVASTLQIKTDVKFASSLKLANGQVQLAYVENIEGVYGAEGKMTMPERFAIAVAPFRCTPKYLVTARLRYRGTAGKAVFKVEIERPHKIVEHAFNDVIAKLGELTGLRALVGSVEPERRPQI